MARSKIFTNKVEMKQIPPVTTGSHSRQEMSRARILKNLIVVCLGFLFLFSAYQALANLQSTMNFEENLGVVSQSVIYAALIVSSLFLPKLVIKKLGCKLTLVLSILTYAPYVAANFYPHLGTFVPTAVVLGFGAAPLWSAKCTYINHISTMYAQYTSDSVDVITSKFFGVFFMVFQNTQIWGNLLSYIVLKPTRKVASGNGTEVDSDAHTYGLHTASTLGGNFSSNATCGVTFFNQTNENLEPPPDSKRHVLICIYLACVLLAAVIVAFFLDPLRRCEEKVEDESLFSRVVATLKHMKKSQQLLMIPLTIFSGIEQAFILGDYTKAYVACVWGLHTVGLVFIFFGIVNALMSFLASRIVKHISRKCVMIIGAIGNIGVCTALFLWEPKETEFIYAFVIVGFWGLSDAIWQTQINAFYGALFRTEAEAGFANYRLWESLGFSIAFAYSSFLDVAYKIYILVGFLLVGMTGYIVVEIQTSRRNMYIVTDSLRNG